MSIKDDLKSYIVKSGWTITNLIEELNKKYDRNDSVQNLSNKLRKGTIRYSEVIEIAEIIGYEIIWDKRK